MDMGDHDGVRHDMKDMDGHATKPDETAKDPDMKMDVVDMLVILGDSESVKRVTATLGQ